MNTERHPCPCCGYRTFAKPARGSGDFCAVCCWEDGPKYTPLREAQKEFLAHGASAPHFRDMVRSPLAGEARSPHWLILPEMHRKVLRFIEKAFADVLLEGGLNLRQQHLFFLDDWTSPEQLRPLASDPLERWQDITEAAMDSPYYPHSLSYLDPASIRFHLPAFMRSDLMQWIRSEGSEGYLIGNLESGPDPKWKGRRTGDFDLLDDLQRQAVAAFLRFLEHYEWYESGSETTALRAGWDQWIPDFIRLAFI